MMKLNSLPDLSKYENRQSGLKESSEPIQGIFYIYKNRIVPDYYSECLASEAVMFNGYLPESDRRRNMYSYRFFADYMKYKYPELCPLSFTSIPRGRVSVACKPLEIIYIDKCYKNNQSIINEVIELYRLKNISIIDNYTCGDCR